MPILRTSFSVGLFFGTLTVLFVHVFPQSFQFNYGIVPQIKVRPVACFLLGNSAASEFYMPTFRNTLFRLHRQVGMKNSHPPAYEDGTECSETSEYKIQTPGNYPDERIRHSEHGESLKLRIRRLFFSFIFCRHKETRNS